jgi:membrane protein required for beta-lactamase induction
MIVWLAEGALLSAIVDEVDMGFSCLLKPLSICLGTLGARGDVGNDIYPWIYANDAD